jgi:CrcB protein
MARFLWVCVGGTVGTGARYLLSGWLSRRFGGGYPIGTLAVNALGSFAIGTLMQVGLATELFSPTVRVALATGLLGGFTTYSSFNYETVAFFREGAAALGFLNVVLMVGVCLAAGFLGSATARWMIAN